MGNLMWGNLGDVVRTADGVDYRLLFLAPTALALAAAVTLFAGFHPAEPQVSEEAEAAA